MQTRQQYEATGNYDRTDTWAYALRDAALAYAREHPGPEGKAVSDWLAAPDPTLTTSAIGDAIAERL